MAELKPNVVVIGGGIAGMETAASLAEMGLSVLIVEREDKLGGQAAQWACMATDACAKCSACLIEDTIARVSDNANIQVLTHAELVGVERKDDVTTLQLQPSRGSVKERSGHVQWPLTEDVVVETQAVVLATGFEPFDPKEHRLLSYGHLPEVVTTKDLDECLHEDALEKFLPEDDSLNRIAFVQCVGSRDRKLGREYCSQFCCKTSIRLVNRLKHLKPNLDITIYYIDLQIMGKEFRSFYQKTLKNVRFLQGVPAEVRPGSEVNHVKLVGTDPKTGLGMVEEYNRVVLAVGMMPDVRNARLVEMFGIETNEYGFFTPAETNGDGQPVAPGVYLAGACTGPADIQVSRLQAMAAVKRIALDLGYGALPEATGASQQAEV